MATSSAPESLHPHAAGAAAAADGTDGLVPLRRTLRPLGVLEDEAGNKLDAGGVFQNKVPIRKEKGREHCSIALKVAHGSAL